MVFDLLGLQWQAQEIGCSAFLRCGFIVKSLPGFINTPALSTPATEGTLINAGDGPWTPVPSSPGLHNQGLPGLGQRGAGIEWRYALLVVTNWVRTRRELTRLVPRPTVWSKKSIYDFSVCMRHMSEDWPLEMSVFKCCVQITY